MAVTQIHLRKWDESFKNTNNFKIVTKLSDLGEPLYYKKILGFLFD